MRQFKLGNRADLHSLPGNSYAFSLTKRQQHVLLLFAVASCFAIVQEQRVDL